MAKKTQELSRRKFIGQTSCAALGNIALLNTLLNLKLINAAAAQQPSGSYKAIVCLFLAGGNDSFNMLVPRDATNYNIYKTVRGGLYNDPLTPGGLALPNAGSAGGILPLNPLGNLAGRQYGLHPAMGELRDLFEAGTAAFVANVGTLIQPGMTKAMHDAGVNVPFGLYSHSDQIEQWQTAFPEGRTTTGWAGRAADLLHPMNAANGLSMNISLGSNNIWQTGNSVVQYAISPRGITSFADYDRTWDLQAWGTSPVRSAAIDSQLAMDYANLLEKTYAVKTKNAIDAYKVFQAATASALPGGVVFPTTDVGKSFQMIAKTIAGRSVLGAQRQTFFVQVGGWDHHDEVINNQQSMLGEISQAVKAFHDVLIPLGVADQVTTFSSSDFGRTLTSNGKGSDHAWGGNHFVVGGAVNGRRIYGQYPELADGNPLDTGRGRLIPSISVDEYFAELALWFGVPQSSLSQVIPNIARFYNTSSSTPPIGFFNL